MTAETPVTSVEPLLKIQDALRSAALSVEIAGYAVPAQGHTGEHGS